MKLHLPSGLRAALFACFAAFAGIGTTISTATITGGVFAVAIAGQSVYATDYIGGVSGTKIVGRETADGDVTELHSMTANDTVTFAGVSGWFPVNNSTTYNANLVLNPGTDGAAALTVSDASSGRVYTFTGSVSGEGDFDITTTVGGAITIVFTGDISAYTGDMSIINTSGGARTLDIKNETEDGTVRVVNAASITASARDNFTVQIFGQNQINSALDIKVLKIRNTSVTELTKGGSVDELIVDSGATLKIAAGGALTLTDATFNGGLEVAGAEGDKAAGALTLNGTITGLVGSVNNGAVTFGENAVVTLGDSTFTQQEDGSYTLALFSADSTGTMTGLTVDNLDGVVTAGREWTFDENGTISYTITCQDLHYTGGTLEWNVGATMQDGTFADGDMVTFTGETEATLGAPITSAMVTVENEATLSLTNGGVEANTLKTEALTVNGTLALKDAALAAETRVTADSTGTVEIAIASGASISLANQLADFTGTLDVTSGRYALNAAKATPFASINIYDGGQLDLTTAYSGNIYLEGHGTSTDAWRDTAMRVSGDISGKVTIGDAGSSIAVYSGDYTISGELAGAGDLKKTEGGTLILTGNITNTGTLTIQAGKVAIGSAPGHTNAISFSGINVGSNATLQLHHAGGDYSGTDLTLSGSSTLHIQDSNVGNTVPMPNPESKVIALGKLTMLGDAKITYTWKGGVSFTELTGTGNIEMEGGAQGNDPRAVIISAMNNYEGTISGTPALQRFYLGTVYQDAGKTAVIGEVGTVYTSSFVKTGAGDLIITDEVEVSGMLTMNYDGGLYYGYTDDNGEIKGDATKTGLNISSVADGTVLTYTTAANLLTLTSTAVGESKLTLDLGAALLNGVPEEGIDLGIAEDVDQTKLVVGSTAKGGELVQKDGTWWYTGGSFHTDWDINWGSAELATAPSSVVSVDDYSGTRSLGDYTTPDSDPAVKPYLNDSTTSILIAGTSADNGELIGGESSEISNTGRTVELDSWIKMTGGNLHLIVGGNYCNNWGGGNAVNFLGDSHILIESAGEGEAAAVVDYIIGGNYKDGKGPLFTGNSYISIKSDSLQGGIIGGSTVAHSSTTTFRGDSNIYIYTPQTLEADSALINLSAENGNVIVGGNAKLTNVNGTLNFDGNTNITLDFEDFTATNASATMAKVIIGGSYTYSFSGNAVEGVTHTGDTNITIRNADTTTFSKDVVGGSVMNAQTITQAGTANIDISSGIYTGNIIGGHYSTAGGATFSLGGVDVNLSGGTFKGDIYAAGYIGGADSTMTTGSTTVTIGDDVVLGETDAAITVSGGYTGSGTGTVTGDRTLNIAGTHDNATFKDFDVLNVVKDSAASIKLVADSAITKAGAGALTLAAGSTVGTVTVQEGALALGGNTLTAVTVMGDATLDGSVSGSNAGALTLGANAGDIISIQVGNGIAVDSLTLAAGAQLNVLDTMTGDTLTLFTGLNFADTSGLGIDFTDEGEVKVADITTYISNADSFTNGKLILDSSGNLVISTNASYGAWEWEDTTDNGIWKAGSDAGWSATGATPDGQALVFGDKGVGADNSTTVTIEGEVKPASVLVNVSEGKGYVFESSATTAGVIADSTEATTLTKQGAGSLTINVANTYSGGTKMEGGTLTVQDAAALGTGEVDLTAGTLVLEAAVTNLIRFNQGTLQYSTNATTELAKFARVDSADSLVKVVVDDGYSVTWDKASAAQSGYILQNGVELSGTGTLTIATEGDTNLGPKFSLATGSNLVIQSNIDGSNNINFTSTLEGAGTVTFDGKKGAATLNADNSAYAGTIVVQNTTIGDAQGDTFYFQHANASGGANTTLVLNGACIRAEGDGYVYTAGTVNVLGDNVINGGYWGSATSYKIAGALTGNGTLAIHKASTMTLGGSLQQFTGKLTNNQADVAVAVVFGEGGAYVADGNIFGDGAELTSKADTTAAPTYGFNYSNTVNVNALVSGVADVEQNGTGTLVLTKDNTSTGKLEVNKGTVEVNGGSWVGSVEVGTEGTLHLVSQTAGKEITAVTNNGTVVLEAANNLTTLSGGKLTVNGDATVGSVTNALDTLNIASGKTLTVNGNVTVGALENDGTLKLDDGSSRHSLTLTAGTEKGGDIVANQVSIGGDSSFGSVDANNSFKANGHSVTFGGTTNIVNGLQGVKNLTANADVTVDSDLTLTGALSGTGSLTVSGGNLVLGAASELGGALTVAGGSLTVTNGLKVDSLAGVNTISFAQETTGTKLTPEPTVTVTNAFDVGGSTLTFQFAEDAQLTALGLSGDTQFTLMQTGGITTTGTDPLKIMAAINGGTATEGGVEIGSYTYTIKVDDTDANKIVITCSAAADYTWDGSSSGTWSESGSWESGGGAASTAPDKDATVGFFGSGSDTVNVEGSVTADKVVVDTTQTPGTTLDGYTFEGEGATVNTGELSVTAGDLALNVDANVADADDTTDSALTVVGSLADNVTTRATLTVGTDAALTTESLVVNTSGGFANEGTTTVEGDLIGRTDDEGSIKNTETLNVGGNASFSNETVVSNTGTMEVTGNVALADTATLTNDDTMKVGGDMTVADTATLTNNDALTVTGKLDATGATVTNAADAVLTVGAGSTIGTLDGEGALVADGATTIDTLGSAGSVSVADNATLNVTNVTGNSLASVTVGEGATMTVTAAPALTVNGLTGTGTFSAEQSVVTLAAAVTDKTNLTASSLNLMAASGSVLGDVKADSYTLDLGDFTALPVDGGETAETLVTANTISGLTDAGTISVTLGNVGKLLALSATEGDLLGDYILMSQTGDNATALTSVTLTNEEWIRQQFAEKGHYYAGLADTTTFAAVAVGNNVVLRVQEDPVREWTTGTDSIVSETHGGTVLDISGIDSWYEKLVIVDKVNVDGDATIDLTGADGYDDQKDAADTEGLVLRNVNGDADTDNLTLIGTAADKATLTNNANSALKGTLALQGDGFTTDVAAYGDTAGSILTVGTLDVSDGAQLNVTDTGSLAVSGDTTLTDSAVTVNDGGTLTLTGKTTLDDSDGSTALTVEDGGTLKAGEVELKGTGAQLTSAGDTTVAAINGSAGTISGTIKVDGTTGSYSGSYGAGATVDILAKAKQDLTVGGTSGSENLSIKAASGASTTISYKDGDATVNSIKTNGADITLDNNATNTLTATAASSINGGTLGFSVNGTDLAATSGKPTVLSGADVNGTTVNVGQADTVTKAAFDVSKGTKGWTLFTLTDAAAEDVTVQLDPNSAFYNRYFRNVTVENGVVKADLITDHYTSRLGITDNGKAGMQMLDMAYLQLAPETGDLANVFKSLDDYVATDSKSAADKLAAAVAGTGLSGLGMALSGDVERQLKAIRNRTTTMGVDPAVVNEDMPYFNAWINAEGDHRSLDEDGTLAGYTLTSWGGTVGFDMDVTPNFTCGLALTAMYGNYTSESADAVEGDVDTYYISAFARATAGAWVHTFVATAGQSWIDVNRTVSHANGNYTTNGDADGVSFGFLYEVARTFALNEDATACWQPVFNVSYRHAELESFGESGSDAALAVGEQSLDTLTFGLGGRVQAIVGENLYNRTSVFEARALAKLDAGDRESEVDTQLLSASAAQATVTTAEMDAFGIELGAGLTIPMGMDGGSVFVDGSVEFRGSYTSANATLGYRFNF